MNNRWFKLTSVSFHEDGLVTLKADIWKPEEEHDIREEKQEAHFNTLFS